MMAIIENPQISLEELNQLEVKVKINTATVGDYEKLDSYMSFLGFPRYLVSKMNDSNIDNFETFIYRRRFGYSSEVNMLIGTVMGVISFLRKHISGKGNL